MFYNKNIRGTVRKNDENMWLKLHEFVFDYIIIARKKRSYKEKQKFNKNAIFWK